jgi:molybdate/tungstate transport system permease protein
MLITFFWVSLPLAQTWDNHSIVLSLVRAIGESGATMMMAYNLHTTSSQIFEDYGIGGLEQRISGIILPLMFAVVIIFVLCVAGTKYHKIINLCLCKSEVSKISL